MRSLKVFDLERIFYGWLGQGFDTDYKGIPLFTFIAAVVGVCDKHPYLQHYAVQVSHNIKSYPSKAFLNKMLEEHS